VHLHTHTPHTHAFAHTTHTHTHPDSVLIYQELARDAIVPYQTSSKVVGSHEISRYVMDGITEMACFLRKNRDLSIENGLD